MTDSSPAISPDNTPTEADPLQDNARQGAMPRAINSAAEVSNLHDARDTDGDSQPKPYLTIKPASGWAPLDLAELWRFRELFWIFADRDIKVRYKQTILGAAWAIVQRSEPFNTLPSGRFFLLALSR